MTWSQNIYSIDGNTQNSATWRQALAAATQFNEGVVGHGDLYVTASSPNSLVLHVGSGACAVIGSEVANQGTYFGVNIGDDTVSVAAGGGADRWDLIVAEVQDPTFPGSPWSHNPLTDQLIYTVNIAGVSSATIAPPLGLSAIPLALVHIPAGASTISQANITDLRSLVNPPWLPGSITQVGGSSSSIAGGTTPAQAWPTWFNSSVQVPVWATHMRITTFWHQFKPASAGAATTGPKLTLSVVVGGLASLTVPCDNSWLAFASPEVDSRHTAMLSDTIDVHTLAGTLVAIVPTAVGQVTPGTATGTAVMDTSSSVSILYEFLCRPGAP